MTTDTMTSLTTHARRINREHVLLLPGGVLALALCIGAAPVKAADASSAAAAALKVLTAGAQPSAGEEVPGTVGQATGRTPPSPSAMPQSITVQSGESIDAVLRRALPGLPLREDFLRQALAQANPRIFPRGKTYPVRPGSVLMVPTHAQLRQMILLQSPAAAALFEAPTTTVQADLPKGPDKRHWVRFP